jgi:LmbE family N-acetylglucosaminyl deacetylase
VTVTGDAAGELTPRAAGAPPEHEVRAAGGSAGEQPPAGAGAQPSDVEPTTPSVTPPGAWEAALRRHRPLPFDPTGLERVVVVAAHPDDETIGVGGLLQELHAAGASITLVVATDGEAAYPGLDGPARRELGRARRVELADALRVQGLADAPVHWLGLPDSGLADRVPELTDRLAPLLADADAYLAPWTSDPHPDHRAAGAAAAAAAPVTARGWAYPIWTWAWTGPDDPGIPWERARAVTVDARVRATRRRAVDCFTSQVRPGPDGSAPVLAAGLLEHVDRNTDIVFREPRQGSAPLSRFTELYAGGNDPWRAGSWYERRKRAVLLASLPRETYGTAFEPGCGAGELSVELASRCRLVLASDPVPEAVVVGAEHRHVYGANLGVRADAYLAVGGFPADGAGEDHGLWERLRAAGYPLVSPASPRVTTSARLHGRAEGGLADLLLSLQTGCRPAEPADTADGTDAPAG